MKAGKSTSLKSTSDHATKKVEIPSSPGTKPSSKDDTSGQKIE